MLFWLNLKGWVISLAPAYRRLGAKSVGLGKPPICISSCEESAAMKIGSWIFVSAITLAAEIGIAKAEDITIAVAGPMTGPVATIGEQIKRGAELAAEAINKNGGV